MKLLRTFVAAVLPLLIVALAVPAARASVRQTMTFEAPRDLLDPARRPPALDELSSLGVVSLRVVLYWHNVAPAADDRVRPAFDATDPGQYNWGEYAPLLDAATQRGWRVVLTLSGPVPRWATEGAKDTVTRPRVKEFGKFATAVGKRFGPQVVAYTIWNEPNHPQFLLPQYDSRHHTVSPKLYRSLFQAAQRGLTAAGQGDAPILMGETAPRGTGKVVAPLTFLRGALCLDSHYHRVGHCAKLDVDGYAHHAYTTAAGPFFHPSQPNDVTIGVLGRLTTALDRAARAGAIPAKLPVMLTEFGIQSTPDPYVGVSLERQLEYRAISERIAWSNPRVAAFSQYLLTDDAPRAGVPRAARYGGFESGLIAATGKRKPAFDAFRLPVSARRIGGGKVSLWGLVRPAGGPYTVTVERADKGSMFHRIATVKTDARGYWTLRTTDKPSRRWRVKWRATDGTLFTAPPVRAYTW